MEHKEVCSQLPPKLRVTDPAINWGLDDGVINAVITAAGGVAGDDKRAEQRGGEDEGGHGQRLFVPGHD